VNNENVCKKTVSKIFGITQRRIQCLLDKMKCKRNVEDQIGKHENRSKKVQNPDIDKICNNISPYHYKKIIIAERSLLKNVFL
jgi:hypothetical protein